MNKPIAERLREYTKKYRSYSTCGFYENFGADISNCEGRDCAECRDEALNKIADEIEREQKERFIKRPCFEDGTPVQFGDEVKDCKGAIYAMLIFSDGSGMLFGKDDDPWNAYNGYDFGTNGIVERQIKSVLDADGVEIKVGEKIYDEKGNEYTVTNYCSSKDCVIADNSNGEGYHLIGYLYTHECPVFDANNERIKVGDTVYSIKGSDELTVKKILDDCVEVNENILNYPFDLITHEKPVFDANNERIKVGDFLYWESTGKRAGRVKEVTGDGVRFEEFIGLYGGYDFTHKEPDSLEKLRDDISNTQFDEAENELCGWVDRLTALIERGA